LRGQETKKNILLLNLIFVPMQFAFHSFASMLMLCVDEIMMPELHREAWGKERCDLAKVCSVL